MRGMWGWRDIETFPEPLLENTGAADVVLTSENISSIDGASLNHIERSDVFGGTQMAVQNRLLSMRILILRIPAIAPKSWTPRFSLPSSR